MRGHIFKSLQTKIDVTVATRNNARTIDRCLKCIRANIPVKRIVVVDNGSTDATVEIAKKNSALVVREHGFLGRVRYEQAAHCSTDWIAFIDSDIYVRRSWWPTVSRYMNAPLVAMVLAGGYSPGPPRIYQSFMLNVFRRWGASAFSNTLVKREVVLSCTELLGIVPIEEDGIFVRHIKDDGLKVVTIPEMLVYHDSVIWKNAPKAYRRWGRGIRITKGLSGSKNLAKTLRDLLRDYLFFVRDTKKVSLPLFFFLLWLWLHQLVGFVLVNRQVV